jgi:hypothetical protein
MGGSTMPSYDEYRESNDYGSFNDPERHYLMG